MINAIFIAQTGLRGFENGLRAIAHNTANLNTPGFKGSFNVFTDMFYGRASVFGDQRFGQLGNGLNSLGTLISFQKGQLQNTGNPLDLAVDGQGFFTLRDANGNLFYTQDGRFTFDASGNLVSVTTGDQVMGRDAGGTLAPISLTNLQTNAPRATTTLTFGGNLSTGASSHTISNLTIIDSSGATHTLTLELTAVSGTPGEWTATLREGTATVGTGTLRFQGGLPVPGSDQLTLTYTPAGGSAMPLTLNFGSNVTSFDSGSTSTLALNRQDGYALGTLNQASFDATGTLVLSYSNGQTVRSRQLALAQFQSEDDAEAVGNNLFQAKAGSQWTLGTAGAGSFGRIQSGQLEMANVDLSQEFSNLVIMQRGYQACSQVVATSSEMLTALFSMQKS